MSAGFDIGQDADGDYSRCRTPAELERVLDRLPRRTSVAWNDAVALAGKDMGALFRHARLHGAAQAKNRVAEVFRAVQAIEQRSKA